jgi:outer membrane protein OmpA-like peptidoglycan-associated protein
MGCAGGTVHERHCVHGAACADAAEFHGVFLRRRHGKLARPAGEKTLKKFVSAYKEKLSGKVDVIGHTESAEASIALSHARADAVRNRLLALGIPSDRIRVIAQGDQHPLVPTRPGVAEPQNRRVKIWLS